MGPMAHMEATLCCSCGYGVRVEARHEQECLGVLVFFDDEEASETRGERVGRCPRCGGLIDLYRPLSQT
jgi:hypothetical protein